MQQKRKSTKQSFTHKRAQSAQAPSEVDASQVDEKPAQADRNPRIRDLRRSQERLLAVSRTAGKAQRVLGPVRIFEAIGDELGNLGLGCFFGLLDERGEDLVLRYINLPSETLRAAETLAGTPAVGFKFAADACPHLRSVIREGLASFDVEIAESVRQVLPSPLKATASEITRLLQAHRAISAPLIAGKEILGVLSVWSDHLSEEDVPLVSVFAQQAAMAIENAGLYQQEMRRIFQLEALYNTTLDITRQLDVPELLNSIVERAAALLGTKSGGLYLYHPEEQQLELAVSHYLNEDYTGTRLKVGEGLSGKVVAKGEPMMVDDYANWEGRSEKYDGAPFRGIIAVPLKWGKEIIGVLNVTDVETPRVFRDLDLWLLELFANQAAIALHNARSHADTRRRISQLTALREISLQLTQSLDLSTVLHAVAESAVRLVGASDAHIFLYDEGNFTLGTGVWSPDQRGSVITKVREDGLTATVAKSGQPVVINDAKNHPLYSDKVGQEWGVEAIAGFPLKRAGKILGVFNVAFLEPHTFDEEELRLLALLADQAAIAIENARLYQEQERRNLELMALHETSLQITSRLDLDSLLEAIVARAVELLDGRTGQLYLYRAAGHDLITRASHHMPAELTHATLGPGEGLAGTILQSAEPLIVDDYDSWDGLADKYTGYGFGRVVGVPIRYAEEFLGAVVIERGLDKPRFTEKDVNLLTLFANQAATAIENARLFAGRERRIKQLAALHYVSLEVVAKIDLSEVLPAIVQQAAQLLDADAGAINLFDPETHELDVSAVYGYHQAWSGTRHAMGEGVVGTVAQSQQPFIVDDYVHWEGRSPQWEGQPVGTVMGVPLKRGDQFLGVLTIDRPSSLPFDDDDLQLATLFANQAAIAIENARSLDATRRRVRELTALRETSLQLTQSLDLPRVLDTIAQSAVQLVNASDAHIFLYDQETGKFTFGTAAWPQGREGKVYKHVRENGLTSTVARRGEPLLVNDVKTHPLFKEDLERREGMEAIAGFPLRRGDKVVGVFNVAFAEPHTFDEDELRVLTLLGDQAAIAIENARLYQEIDRRLRESNTLRQVSRLVNSSLQQEQIFQTVVERLAEAFGYSMVSIYIVEGEGLRLGAQVGSDPSKAIHFMPLHRGVIGRVARSGEPALVTDVTQDPDYMAAAPGLVSEVAVPIMKDSTVLGVLNVESTTSQPLSRSDLSLTESLANQVSVAIQNAQLYQTAKRELAERQSAEEAYRAVVDHSLQGLAIVQDYRIVFANQAAADIIGYTVDQLLSLSADEVRVLVHPEDRDFVWGRFQERLAGEPRPSLYGCRIVRKDGSVVWAEIFVNPITYHGRPAVQAALVDITDRKLAEQSLIESEEKFRSLAERSPNMIFINRAGRVLYANEICEQITEYTREEFYSPDFDFMALIAPDSRDLVAESFSKHTRGEQVAPCEYTLVTKEGKPIEAILATSLISYGGETAILAVITDITERKRAEQDLQDSLHKLRRTLTGTVNALAALAEKRDPYTAGHQQRVARLACAIAEEMALPEEEIQGIRMAGLVHDIGKICVPAEILTKPTQLTEIETKMIQTHPQTAYDILKSIEFPWPVAPIVFQHHERLDGSGYPQGLSGDEILMPARILAVADVVEAMASDRPYRPAYGIDEALDEISVHKGTLYDPQVVHACLKLFKQRGFKLQDA